MPTLFARRYARRIEDVSNTEKVLGGLILLLVAAVIVMFVVQVATDEDHLFEVDPQAYVTVRPEPGGTEAEIAQSAAFEAADVFPEPGLAGWCAPTRVDRFTADSLFAKIDGRAEAYLRFDVVELTFGSYFRENDAAQTVDVYWYDMGRPDNALGMYQSEQPPGATPVAVGRAGYEVGGAVFFCKGSSYVQVLPGRLDDADTRAALTIAGRLAERIEERGGRAPSRP